MPQPAESFGFHLRRLREAAGLTREVLAERAGLSANAIAALERGERRHPYAHTVTALADALELEDPERDALRKAVPGRFAIPQHESDRAVLLVPPTRLVGREQDVAVVVDLLRRGRGLVTLTGPGGVGKTRLALAVMEAAASLFTDGIVFVDLSALVDPALVVPMIARTLGIREGTTLGLLEGLQTYLQHRRLLLVLDKFEQVLAAARSIATLLGATSDLTLLVTSRTPLRIRGEREYGVAPLASPELSRVPTDAEIADVASVALFVARAQDMVPGFALTRSNAATIATICRRLDGLPLALELAAARLKLLSPTALLARLDRALPLLANGPRDLPERQQTMRVTIQWSYDLLGETTQKLFRRLAVFAGGFTLDAAEAVGGIEPDDIFEVLISLVDQSLVTVVPTTDQEVPRFRLLEPVRQYALELLEAAGEAAQAIRRAHADYYCGLAGQAEPQLWGGEQEQWLARLEQEHDNLRAALAWYSTWDEGAEPGLNMAGDLWRFWEMHGHWSEGQQWLEQALSRRDHVSPAARWVGLHGGGNLAFAKGEYARARAYYEESLNVTRQLGTKRGIANSLLNLSLVILNQGDIRRAIELQEQALAIHREQSNTIGIALALNNLARMLEYQGDYDRSALVAAESLKHYHELRDSRGVGWSLQALAILAHRRGKHSEARDLLEQCRAIFRKLKAQTDLVAVLNALGELDFDLGDYTQAKALYNESLALATELGDRRCQASVLHNLGRLAHVMGDDSATELYNESLALQRELSDKRGIGLVLESQGWLSLQQKSYAYAAMLLRESLTLMQDVGDQVAIARCLEALRSVEHAIQDSVSDDINR